MIQFLANFSTNIFVYLGVYYLIYIIWTQIEITKFGEVKTSKRDTIICLSLSFIVVLVLAILR